MSSQPRHHQKEEDNERLRSDNVRLGSTIQELQLEISYYKGELKRLEWEKNLLKQDVTKMSALFKGWLAELQGSNTRSIIEDVDYFTNMVLNPALPMQKVLEMQDKLVLLTSCQPPFFIEYATKAWSQACGWESDEVLGLTCAFLQGECTDLKVAAAFTKDVKEVGYGTMRINNYRKNGELFTATVIVFPVYDTVEPTGNETENPVLTHFATMLTHVQTLKHEEVEPVIPTSISKCGLGTSGKNNTVRSDVPYDRRQNCRKYDIEYALTPDSFKDISTTVRLSDLLRLMLCSSEAMVLYDTEDRIVHTNKAYTRMTGYTLSDVEGKNNYSALQGPLTDVLAVQRCAVSCRKQEQVSSVTVTNYRKDGLLFNNLMTVAPVRGGHMNHEITHYCALMQEATGSMLLGLPLVPLIATSQHSGMTVQGQDIIMKRDRESCQTGGSDNDEYHTKPMNRTTMVRDVNYFECEEEDDDDDDQDVAMKYTNIPTIATSSTSQLPPPPPVILSNNHQQANHSSMDIDQDMQTIDTRHYSLASGVTDRSDHSNSSHTTVVEKFAYKDGGRRVRPSREPTTTDGHHMDKHHDHKVHHHHDHHHDKHITKTAASSITKGTKTVSSHNNHVDQTTMDKMKINHSDKTASLSSSSCKGTSSSSSSLEEGSSDDQDAIEMGLKMWACDQLSVESKRNKSKVDDKNKDKELQHIQDKSQDPPRAVFGSLSIKLPSQLLSSSDHKQHQHQHHSSFTSGKSTTSSGFGSVGSDDSCTDSNGSTTGEVGQRKALTAQHLNQYTKHSGYSSTDTNSDFSKDCSSSSSNPSPHSDQEDSTNLQLLSRCTMSSASNGNPVKKHHHDHVTAAGQGLATKDVNNHMSVSQTEADEGIALLTGMYYDLNVPASS